MGAGYQNTALVLLILEHMVHMNDYILPDFRTKRLRNQHPTMIFPFNLILEIPNLRYVLV